MSGLSSQSSDTSQLSEEEERKIKKLKAVVIGLGVLILLALFTLVLGLALGGKSDDSETATIVTTSSPSAPLPANMTDIALPLPNDAVIQEMDLMGNRIAVRWLNTQDAKEQIWIIDLESGVVLRKLKRP